jgi:hypothetical protein
MLQVHWQRSEQCNSAGLCAGGESFTGPAVCSNLQSITLTNKHRLDKSVLPIMLQGVDFPS